MIILLCPAFARLRVYRYPDRSHAAEFGIMDEVPSPGLPAVRLYQRGKVRAEMAIQSLENVRLILNDVTGKERLILFNQSSSDPSKDDSTGLSLQNGEGGDVIQMQADKKGNGGISLLDTDARPRIQLEVWPKDELPDIRPSIMMFDAKGKEIVVIPPPGSGL